MPVRLFCAFLLPATAASAIGPAIVEVPAGTDLQVRLKTKATTDSSKVKDTVEAVVIAPVVVNERTTIPSGTVLRGEIAELIPATASDKRATLLLSFHELVPSHGKPVKVKARVVEVDNARETVEEDGRILGIVASETIASRISQGIAKVAARNPALADILEKTRSSVIQEPNAQIDYLPGVELTVRLLEPVKWDTSGNVLPPIRPLSESEGNQLYSLVNRQPFRTYAEKTGRDSDITNLMFVGTREDLEAAFRDAGWSTAHALDDKSVLETFRAIVEMRGYKEAPVSTLLLDKARPDLVFQKQNNTFAQRHHMRIWQRPGTFLGKPIWVASATHDNGIAFSEEQYTFTHSIDPKIDRERAKVVSDLLFTGRVRSLALAPRPAVPHEAQTATDNPIETDAKMAIVIF